MNLSQLPMKEISARLGLDHEAYLRRKVIANARLLWHSCSKKNAEFVPVCQLSFSHRQPFPTVTVYTCIFFPPAKAFLWQFWDVPLHHLEKNNNNQNWVTWTMQSKRLEAWKTSFNSLHKTSVSPFLICATLACNQSYSRTQSTTWSGWKLICGWFFGSCKRKWERFRPH